MYRTTIDLQVLVKTKLIYGNKNLNLQKLLKVNDQQAPTFERYVQ